MASDKIPVGVLGATGAVGQRFVDLLSKHPNFEIVHLGASAKSAGKSFESACRWQLSADMPKVAASLVVRRCEPLAFSGCRVVFSGMDSGAAGPIETEFKDAGFWVFSNSKNHRYDVDVPILIPYVNPGHLDIVNPTAGGFIVANANCATTGLAAVIGPLSQKFGPLKSATCATLQAVSGGGFPGPSSWSMIDNVLPFIPEEERKMEVETQKILGALVEEGEERWRRIRADSIRVSAMCHRVPVTDGHVVAASVTWHEDVAPPSPEEAIRFLESFKPESSEVSRCHSCPEDPIKYRHEEDRPQPKFDRLHGDGMGVVVGRIRECPVGHLRFTILAHNTIVGAAGGSILNAEFAVAKFGPPRVPQ